MIPSVLPSQFVSYLTAKSRPIIDWVCYSELRACRHLTPARRRLPSPTIRPSTRPERVLAAGRAEPDRRLGGTGEGTQPARASADRSRHHYLRTTGRFVLHWSEYQRKGPAGFAAIRATDGKALKWHIWQLSVGSNDLRLVRVSGKGCIPHVWRGEDSADPKFGRTSQENPMHNLKKLICYLVTGLAPDTMTSAEVNDRFNDFVADSSPPQVIFHDHFIGEPGGVAPFYIEHVEERDALL